jgi:hypothetical protein
MEGKASSVSPGGAASPASPASQASPRGGEQHVASSAYGAGGAGPSHALPQSLVLEHVSPATRLLEKRRQMFEVQEALDAQKEEFTRREEAFHRREEGLRKKDLELQESLIKFNKFLQENESKRNRAEKRAMDEAKQRRQKEAEIARLQGDLEAMRGEYATLERVVGGNLKYQRYLETVQEAVPEDYPEVSDLLNRYKTLSDANRDLTERLQTHEDLNESKRAEFVHFTKEQTNDILNFNNKIATMQKALETSESEVLRLQGDVDGQIRSVSDRTLEIGQALMAISNLLQRCTSKKHGAHLKHYQAFLDEQAQAQHQIPVYKRQDELTRKGALAMGELDVIASYLSDFRTMADEAKGVKFEKPLSLTAQERAQDLAILNERPTSSSGGDMSESRLTGSIIASESSFKPQRSSKK